MTSRIPPSRRDPEYAPQRAAKVVQQQTPGAGRVAGVARVGVSEAVKAALRGRPMEQARGALGYAEVSFADFTVLSNSSGVASASASFTQEIGDHGLTISTNTLTYAEGSVYVTRLVFNVDPTTNAVAGDLHRIIGVHGGPVSGPTFTSFGLEQVQFEATGIDYIDDPAYSGCGLTVFAACSGGTNRSYDVKNASVSIARISAPPM